MTNLKALMEKRAELQQRMEALVSTADTETRAMTDEETAQFDAAEKEIRAIDETVEREERAVVPNGSRFLPTRRTARRGGTRFCGLCYGQGLRTACPASRTWT